jgi:hypothetical protein
LLRGELHTWPSKTVSKINNWLNAESLCTQITN